MVKRKVGNSKWHTKGGVWMLVRRDRIMERKIFWLTIISMLVRRDRIMEGKIYWLTIISMLVRRDRIMERKIYWLTIISMLVRRDRIMERKIYWLTIILSAISLLPIDLFNTYHMNSAFYTYWSASLEVKSKKFHLQAANETRLCIKSFSSISHLHFGG